MNYQQSEHHIATIDARAIAVISYLSIVGWVIALLMHGRNPSECSAFHLRQSLGLFLTWVVLSFIPVIGWLLAVPLFALWVIGIYHAWTKQQLYLPLLGKWFDESFNSLIRRHHG
ncbi:hypothetical protein QWY77_10180 [Thalassotalea ponticola]|uniref:DUF4870 domain-containing protein n=1 Tax=Thalassotalea ponticola TaxID=1523392 RepID=UPI0025B39688|nr:hypothetical protein [Thalassotalea ponticola]MDN3653117.1 hypothetical protein [Thalassotalea ponticola]